MIDKLPLPKPILLLLAILVVFVSLDGLGDRKLANPDEGRYSEIAREMAQSGDFVTPRLNDLKYFEKPPMQYWATAISFKLFGESEFSARLYTALCGLGCLLIMAYVGWRLYDAETGLLVGLVLLSSPYFAAMNEIVTLDMGLTFWMTLGVAAFLLSQAAQDDPSRKRWLWVAWLGMAGAVLSKGLIGIVFPAAAIFLYGVATRNFRLWLRLEWVKGLLIFFGVTAPWFILVSMKNPEFPHFFFIHEHFERFLSDGHRRTEAWWFFFPILFVGFLPWMVSLIPAMWRGWNAPGIVTSHDAHAFQPLKFTLIFSVFILLFFTKSSSKLPAYILVFFPVLALVIARFIQQVESKVLSWYLLPIVPIALFGLYAAYVAPAKRARYDFSRALYDEMSLWVMAAAGLIAFGALIGFVLLRLNRKWVAIVVISAATMLGIESIERGYEKLSPQQSGHDLAEAIKPFLKNDPNTRLYSVRTYDQTLPFYLKRTITLVDYVDEFEMGQRREPRKAIAKLEDFPAAWTSAGEAIAVINPNEVERMRDLGLKFRIIYENPRRMAILKQSQP